MFINYITLMLINLVAGLFLLAGYVYYGIDRANQKLWIPGFGITGAIALVTGLHVIFTWPLTGSFNIAYGETTVLFGVLFLGASFALAFGWDLLTVAVYGFFAGLVAIVIGVRILRIDATALADRNWVYFNWVGWSFGHTDTFFENKSCLALVGRDRFDCCGFYFCLYRIHGVLESLGQLF
jgi:putative membrane protein